MKYRLILVLVLGAAGAFGMWRWAKAEAESRLPYVDREAVEHARKQGRFDAALDRLARLETSADGVAPARIELIKTHRVLIEDTKRAFDSLHASYMARVLQETERQQIDSLKYLRSTGTPAEREASVILMAGIRDFRMAAEDVAIVRRAGVVPSTTVPAKPSKAPDKLPKPEWLDARVAEICKYQKSRNYVHAIELAKQTLPEVPVQYAGPLLDVMAEVRQGARDEMHKLVAEAYKMRKNGNLAAAVKMLRSEAIRFPGQGNLSYLYRELDQLSAELGVAMPAAPRVNFSPRKSRPVVASKGGAPVTPNRKDPVQEPPTNERPTGRLDKRLITRVLRDVEKAEKAGDLQTALTLLTESIEQNSAYQPGLARHLGEIRSDLELIHTLATATAWVGAEFAGKIIKLRDGKRVRIVGIRGAKVQAKTDGQARDLAWLDLPLSFVEQLAEAADIDPRTRLGIAALGYRQEEDRAAEAYLVRLLRADASLSQSASKIISRGRGEYVDEEGYTIVGGKFVAVRFIKVRKLARQFAGKLSRFGRMSAEEREKALEKIREPDEYGTEDALVLALKDQLKVLADKVGRSTLPKALVKMSARREELDAARNHARDLIYDSKTYFYPYKPPAVSGAKHSKYNKVQKEVDVRVAALRKIWDDKLLIPVPARLRNEIEFLLWTENQLGMMGEVSDGVLSHMDWIHTIPPVENLSLQSFCTSAEEKDAFVHYAKVYALNERLSSELNSGEVAQVRVTNAYRAMFGHRPLAIDLRLHKAAHDHGEEMSRLGYFSHTSPTKERRTPFRRMKLVNYNAGVSENIARGGSAAGVHVRWCHSSGHHRNLLNSRHTEVGIGNYGNYWVQNFGRGRDYDK
ncbi:MAG: CAP domain-containing protein [Planctomycetota bacterium]|nr:CAP domain-containing protein [Planctomycetota bacterium]